MWGNSIRARSQHRSRRKSNSALAKASVAATGVSRLQLGQKTGCIFFAVRRTASDCTTDNTHKKERVMGKTSHRAKGSNRAPPASEAEMPSWMVSEIVNMVIDKWRGTLEQYKEDSLRNSSDGLYDAIFCEHNEHIAALAVLKAHHIAVPDREKTEVIAMAKELLNYTAAV